MKNIGPEYLDRLLIGLNILVNKPIKPALLTSRIRKCLSEILLDVKTERTPDVDYDTVQLSATFASWKEVQVQLEIIYHTDQKIIKLSQYALENLKEQIIGAVLHEFHHMSQYKKRNNKDQRRLTQKEKKSINKAHICDGMYMASPDECDTYAMHTSLLLKRSFSQDQIKDVLRHVRQTEIHGFLNRYILLFKENSPIRKRFFKKLYLNCLDD